jgi:hypothetical protein
MSLPSVLAWLLYLIHWYYPPWYNKFIRACRFWSLVFMQGFSVESNTSGISLSSTSWQYLEAQYKSSNDVNITPRSPGTKPEKMKNSEDPVRKVSNLAGQGSSSNPNRNWRQGPTCRRGEGSRRLEKQHQAKQAVGWAEVGPGRSAQPISRPSQLPLWPSCHLDYL